MSQYAGAKGVQTVLEAASTERDGWLQTLISFAVLALGATTVFSELQDDLNRPHARPQTPEAGDQALSDRIVLLLQRAVILFVAAALRRG